MCFLFMLLKYYQDCIIYLNSLQSHHCKMSVVTVLPVSPHCVVGSERVTYRSPCPRRAPCEDSV